MNFEDIFNDLKGQIVELAKISVKKYAEEARQDGEEFLENSKEKLEKWTRLLADGQITTEEFEWLVNSQYGLAKMKLLTQAGIAQIRADQFKHAVLNTVADVIIDRVFG